MEGEDEEKGGQEEGRRRGEREETCFLELAENVQCQFH